MDDEYMFIVCFHTHTHSTNARTQTQQRHRIIYIQNPFSLPRVMRRLIYQDYASELVRSNMDSTNGRPFENFASEKYFIKVWRTEAPKVRE
jgi:hypothetical protein